MRPEHYDVVVIGGGQAGLAIGYHLAQQGRRFTILEAAGEPASAWRGRWDSLRLFTSVRYDSLPGLDFPGDPDSYPGRDEVIAYLTDYAQRFELPVEFNSRVQAVRARDGGGFLVELADRTYEADQVVVATGPFQVPFTPAIAADLSREVVQLHSTQYRSPDELPTGTVLVVGGGNTGYQISEELAHSREVHLAIGARQMPLPQRILGRDLFRYLQATGLMYKTVDSRLARRLKDKETLIGSSPRAARARHPAAATRDRGSGSQRHVRRRLRTRRRRGGVGDRLPARPLLRAAPGLRRTRSRDASARRHRRPRRVLPRPALAAHPRLGAAGLGQRRRAVHRPTHRRVRPRPRDLVGPVGL
jgi:cation diffusion facilitator CzcD-associated flavoprotein CzcO